MKNTVTPGYLLGIDGGATKTVFALADKDGNVLKELCLGPCNPFDIGSYSAFNVLSDGIKKTIGNVNPSEICAFAGLSGGASGDTKLQFHNLLSDFGFAAFDNGSDMQNAVATALGNDDGTCAVIGTGNVIAVQKNGRIHRYGGYGYLFDDTLSGYDLGREAIKYALAVEEGTTPSSTLYNLVKEKCGATVLDSLSDIYSRGKSLIASFAPLVFEAIKSGDVSAKMILCQQLMKFTEKLSAAMDAEGVDDCDVKLIGGLCKAQDVIGPLLSDISDGLYSFEFCDDRQIKGALLLAKNLFNKVCEDPSHA